MPMFPLGSVLLPTMLLPLRIFEPRYRTLIRRVLDGDGRFGVVLIERGSEVGGGDVRTMVGCTARVLDAEERADGQWGVVAVGEERVRVERWLPDDPHPLADVVPWPDEAGGEPDRRRIAELVPAWQEVLDLVGAATGSEVPSVELADDPATASYQLAISAPLGAFDRQRVLCAASVSDRLELLAELLDDAATVLRAGLGP